MYTIQRTLQYTLEYTLQCGVQYIMPHTGRVEGRIYAATDTATYGTGTLCTPYSTNLSVLVIHFPEGSQWLHTGKNHSNVREEACSKCVFRFPAVL